MHLSAIGLWTAADNAICSAVACCEKAFLKPSSGIQMKPSASGASWATGSVFRLDRRPLQPSHLRLELIPRHKPVPSRARHSLRRSQRLHKREPQESPVLANGLWSASKPRCHRRVRSEGSELRLPANLVLQDRELRLSNWNHRPTLREPQLRWCCLELSSFESFLLSKARSIRVNQEIAEYAQR
jgi:hypothetical protein